MNCDLCGTKVVDSSEDLIYAYENRDRLRNDPHAASALLGKMIVQSKNEAVSIGGAKFRAAVQIGMNPFKDEDFGPGFVAKDTRERGLEVTYTIWRNSALHGKLGQADWNLCRSCAASFEQWWKKHADVRHYEGENLNMLKAIATREGFDGAIPPLVQLEAEKKVAVATAREKTKALEQLRGQIPNGSHVLEPTIRVSGGGELDIDVSAFDANDAVEAANVPPGSKVTSVDQLVAPRNGFLGLGRKAGKWRVTYRFGYEAGGTYYTRAELEVVRNRV